MWAKIAQYIMLTTNATGIEKMIPKSSTQISVTSDYQYLEPRSTADQAITASERGGGIFGGAPEKIRCGAALALSGGRRVDLAA
jgi:hypothetical protein